MDIEIGGLIAKVQEKVKENMVDEWDYIEDGLLYCGKCHTKKQTRVNILGQEHIVYCICHCARERLEKEERERKQKEEIDRLNRLRGMGFPDAEMREWTFDKDDRSNEKLSTAARRYVDNFDTMKAKGKGLLLFGPVGTGKTFLAACIANALIDRHIPCLVTNFSRLVNTIQGNYQNRQEEMDKLNKYTLLVIDDLAAERKTEYMDEVVYNIIDARYRSGLPLIVTTNLTREELQNPSDMAKQRVYSRLFEMCVPIEVAGADRRKKKLRNDYDEMSELLGLR